MALQAALLPLHQQHAFHGLQLRRSQIAIKEHKQLGLEYQQSWLSMPRSSRSTSIMPSTACI